jgi:N-acetyl-alpha-D-muramate 1-phosphate uridylyltransferase
MRGMILAAGLGTRFKPWTDAHPKALAIINGKTLLQRNVEYLQAAGITEVVVNVHHFAGQIVDAVKRSNGWGSRIIISDETDAVLETGGGLLKASPYLHTDMFVMMNVDILTSLDLKAMVAMHKKLMPLATIATTNRKTSRYFLFDHLDNLCGWKNVKSGEEKIMRVAPDVKEKAFSGIHVIDPRIFSLITQQGKFSVVDVYLSLAREEVIKSFDHSESKFIDVGKPEAVSIAQSLFP